MKYSQNYVPNADSPKHSCFCSFLSPLSLRWPNLLCHKGNFIRIYPFCSTRASCHSISFKNIEAILLDPFHYDHGSLGNLQSSIIRYDCDLKEYPASSRVPRDIKFLDKSGMCLTYLFESSLLHHPFWWRQCLCQSHYKAYYFPSTRCLLLILGKSWTNLSLDTTQVKATPWIKNPFLRGLILRNCQD